MKKYFIELCWNDFTPYIHLKDLDKENDEYFNIPNEFNIERINKKICVGTLNPYTREYISCNNIIEENQMQCNKCKYLFDFYKCVRCHGGECYVKNENVLNYCNTPHYVYLAYFPNNKIKVGTASEIKKYNRLLEQGALFSIFVAKTPTGKIARQIEKNIIDNGVSGVVTTSYKMKNIIFNEDLVIIKKILMEKHKENLNIISDENKKYLIEPEFNDFNELKDKVDNNMLSEITQFNLFNDEVKQVKPYIIKNEFRKISGSYLFSIGKVLAIENNGIIELIDTKKIEGCLFEFKNIKTFKLYDEVKYLGGK